MKVFELFEETEWDNVPTQFTSEERVYDEIVHQVRKMKSLTSEFAIKFEHALKGKAVTPSMVEQVQRHLNMILQAIYVIHGDVSDPNRHLFKPRVRPDSIKSYIKGIRQFIEDSFEDGVPLKKQLMGLVRLYRKKMNGVFFQCDELGKRIGGQF